MDEFHYVKKAVAFIFQIYFFKFFFQVNTKGINLKGKLNIIEIFDLESL